MSRALYRLSNGIPVGIDPMPQSTMAALKLVFRVGSRHEAPEDAGISHFNEHMAFQGTARQTHDQIAEEAEELGIDLGASTSRGHTEYRADGPAENIFSMIGNLCDASCHSIYPQQEFSAQKNIILTEALSDLRNPDIQTFNRAIMQAYPGQPYGAPIIGTPESIEAMTPDRMREFQGRHYHAGNLFVSVAGQADPARILACLEESLSSLPPGLPSLSAPMLYVGGAIHLPQEESQFHMDLSYPVRGVEDPDFHVDALMGSVLGGSMSSRLFKNVRERDGLVYSIGTSHLSAPGESMMHIMLEANPENAGAAVDAVARELRELRGNAPSARELGRVRKIFEIGARWRKESVTGRCSDMAGDILYYDRLLAEADEKAKLETVRPEQISEAAARMMAFNPTFSTAGPVDGPALYSRLLENLKL